MKKLVFVLMALMCSGTAMAVLSGGTGGNSGSGLDVDPSMPDKPNIGTSDCGPECGSITTSDTCSSSSKAQCELAQTDTNKDTHVVCTWRATFRSDCRNCQNYCWCDDENISYIGCSCEAGYYGSPDSESSTACKACPANATCSGGASFSCNAGYYMNAAGTGCDICPNTSANWTPVQRGTSDKFATSIKDCYIPVGATFTDDIGTFVVVDEECYHK